MKKALIAGSLLIAIFLVLGVTLFFTIPEEKLSDPQKETIQTFGYPTQFMITYIPQGDENDPTLARSETWYYPLHEMKINFLAGNVFDVEKYQAEETGTSSTSLKPEDFEFSMSYEDVADIIGSSNIEPVDFLPEFYEEGKLETYLSDKAIFIIENGNLSYIQTLGRGPGIAEDSEDLENEENEENETANKSSFFDDFVEVPDSGDTLGE